MKKLRYVCAQPAIDYYAWQVEVMVNNFIKNGVNPNYIDIVCAISNGVVPENWQKLANHYNTVRFFFYEDDRVNPQYISSVRPNILKKHFKAYPELENEAIMYHDCDIILTQPVDWSHYLEDDIWYGSDTISYVGANYVKSKKHGIYERMCQIVGVSESIPEENEKNSIGAQYLMKNINYDFWQKVERDCEDLYKFFLDHLKEHPESPDYHPIQKWTADMWAVLWNAWYYGHETRVVKDMDFIWPSYSVDTWLDYNIYHNAGVTSDGARKNKLFLKSRYTEKLPYNIKLEDFDTTKCNSKYVEAIIETAQRSCLT